MDIQQLKQLKILVIGDYCVDIFKYGHCLRLSPEAPVPIFLYDHEIKTDGMAGNVNNNLLSLNVDSKLLCSNKDILKIRYIDIKSKQHLMREDIEKNISPINIDLNKLQNLDCIVISDYDKGSIINKNIIDIINNFNGPIFVDTKKTDLSVFKKCIIKINEFEFNKSKNIPNDCELIITLGEKGALYKNDIYPVKKVNVFDVSGAGDSFMAGLVVQYLIKKDLKCAINFANICASDVVKKSGTACVDFEEVKNEICF